MDAIRAGEVVNGASGWVGKISGGLAGWIGKVLTIKNIFFALVLIGIIIIAFKLWEADTQNKRNFMNKRREI